MTERGVRVHVLKTWPEYFDAVRDGRKTFEVRRDDRDGFAVGDILRLLRYNPTTGEYTLSAGGEYPQNVTRVVCYVLPGGVFGIEPGFVVLGLKEEGT